MGIIVDVQDKINHETEGNNSRSNFFFFFLRCMSFYSPLSDPHIVPIDIQVLLLHEFLSLGVLSSDLVDCFFRFSQ